MSLDARLQRVWYGPAWRSLPLWPLSLLYRAVIGARTVLRRVGLLPTLHVDAPVIVVGNVTVGGTGKTPVAAWLARQLRLRGRRVGVVLRGYGGSHRGAPRVVTADDSAVEAGDEAVLHARHGAHVVVVGTDRVAAARLAQAQGAEVIVCDDGLQHTRLARDCEIAVVDGARGLGNGWLLPAGPLREPSARLDSVQAVVISRRDGSPRALPDLHGPLQVEARFMPGDAVNLLSAERRPLTDFRRSPDLYAVAGIGHPAAFFSSLRSAGLDPHAVTLADHAALDPAALPFPADASVLMTEKDAVKCMAFARPGWWWVDLEVSIDHAAAAALLAIVLERTGLTGAGVTLG
jgi:tetraacyldisaccharide 4'-kinase